MTAPAQALVFTAQERQILLLAAQGLTDTVAGRHYGISGRTYRRHLVAVSAKLGARNRAHAAALAVALGIIAAADLKPRRTAHRSPIGERPRLKSDASAGSSPAGGTP